LNTYKLIDEFLNKHNRLTQLIIGIIASVILILLAYIFS
jgi:hypothetical protein